MQFMRLQALRTSLKKRRKIVVPVAFATLASLFFIVAAPSNAAPAGTLALIPGSDYTCEETSTWGSSASAACDTDSSTSPSGTRWLAAGYGPDVKITFDKPTYLAGIGFRGAQDDNSGVVENRRITGGTLVGCDDAAFTTCSSTNLTAANWDNIGTSVSYGLYGEQSFDPPSKAYKYYKFTVTRTYGDSMGVANTPSNYACPDNGVGGRCIQLSTIFFFKKNYVTFNANTGSGTAMADQKGITTAALSANTFTAPTDHTFAGWNTAANGSGTWYAAGSNYDFATKTGETLYAQWMKLSSANQSAAQNRAFTSYTPTLERTFSGGSFSSASLPAGLSINSSTGAITGTPTIFGTTAVTVTYTSPSPASVSTTTNFNIVVARERAITFKNVGNVTLSQDTYIEGQTYTMPAATADDATSKFAGWNASTTLTTGFYNAGSSLTGQAGDLTFYERRVNEPSTDFTVAVSGGATTTVSSNHETINMTEPQTAVLTRIGTVSDGGTLTHVWQSGQVTGMGFITSDETSNPDGTLSIDWRTNRYLVEVTNTLNGVSISNLSSHAMIATSQPIVIPSVTNGAGNYQTAGTQVAAPTVTGGLAPYTFSISTGTLPAGLTINSSTGEISGTPTTIATTSGLIMRVRDANGSTEFSNSFNIVVSKKLLDTPATPTVIQISNAQLKVNFTAVTNANSYIVKLFSDSSGTTLVNQYTGFMPGGANTFSGLSAATTYYAQVIAVPSPANSSIYDNSLGSALGSGITNKSTFDITWDLQGGTLTGSTPQATFSYTSSTIAKPGTDPTRAGYVFKGWARSSTATADQLVINKSGFPTSHSPTERMDLTLYAVWGEFPTLNFTYQIGSASPVSATRSASNLNISMPLGASITFVSTGTVSSNGTISYRQYSYLLASGGGSTTYTYSPSAAGNSQVNLYAKNVDAYTGTGGAEISQIMFINVVAPPTIGYANSYTRTVGASMTQIGPSVSGGQSPFTFEVKSGSIPAGLTFSTSTGAFTGTPTTPGPSTLTVEITDALGSKTTSAPFTINVAPLARTLSLTSPSATAAYLTNVQLNTPTQNPSGQGGALSYSAGASTACSVNSTGLVSITSGTGTCSVTATIAANGNYAAATSSAVSITPSKIAQATLNLTLSSTSSASDGTSFSKQITATTTGGSTSGSVTLAASDNNATGCQLSADTSPTTLSSSTSGICQVTATMAGNDNYNSVSKTALFAFSKKLLLNPATYQAAPISGYTDRLNVTFDNSPNVGTYILRYSTNNWTSYSAVANFVPGQSNTLSGLSAGTNYKFRLYVSQSSNTTYIEGVSSGFAEFTATTHALTPTPTVTNASGTLAKNYGQSLSLTAAVSAGTSLSYQWKKDGTAISGATSATFTINSLVFSDAGAYTCDITDTANGITSATATYSAQAVTVSAATLATPAAPTVTTAVSGTGLNASWVAVPGATSYLVRIYEEASSTELGPAKTIASGTTAQFMYSYPTYYIRNSKLYRITVQAIGDGVNYLDSAASSAGSATTVPPASIPTFTDIQSVSQPIGSTVEFTVNDAVSPDGGSISYYWYILNSAGNNVSWPTNVTGQNTKTLKFTGITMAQTGYRIQAVVSNGYLGNFRTKATTIVTLTVTKTLQTITFASLASKDLSSADFNVSATASSGQSVSFTATTAGTCSVTGGTVHIIAAGTCTIAADQVGNSDYEAAPQVRRSFLITAASQTLTFASLSNRAYSATPFTVSATSSAGLTVGFTSATPSVCTISGTSVTMVSTGDCTINADQAGDSIYAAAPQVARTFTIAAASISTPTAPTIAATAGALKSIDVSWSAITNASGYLIKIYNNAASTLLETVVVGNTTSTTIDATDYASIADNTPYKLSIVAVGATNYANSTESATAGVTTNKSYTITYRNTGATAGTAPAAGSYITGAAASSIAQNTGTLARTGYTFAGWNTLAAGNGTNYTANGTGTYSTAQDIDLYPVWTPNAATVTFNSNFGTPTTATQAFVADAAENLDTNTFVNTGYAFLGWATTALGSVSYTDGQSFTTLESTTLYAKWEAIDYTVTYVANGATATVPTETDKNIGNTVTVKSTIARTGYNFQGWSDGTNLYDPADTFNMPATNVTLTASWQIQVYTITYNDNGALAGAPSRTSESYTYGQPALSLPSIGNLVKTGYTFAGWSAIQNGTAISGNYTPTASITLYARWTANTYTVTYNSNGATGTLEKNTDSYTTAATAITLPGAGQMVKPGHTFGGWSTTPTGSALVGTYTTAEDKTLYARWSAVSYTVTYNAAGGNSTPIQASRTIGQTFVLAAGPTKTNFEFAGWNDGTTTYDEGYTYLVEDSNISLTAIWVEIFWIHYNYNGANETEPADLRKLNGQSYTAGPAVTKPGYVFNGWRAQNNDPIAAGETFIVDSNHYILSAQWTAVDYHITYASLGGLVVPTQADKNVGQTFTVANALTRAGYNFGGWSDGTLNYGAGATYTVGTSNINFQAQWSAISYNVTYDLAQGTSTVPVQSNRTIGQTFTIPAMPTRYGYSFVKWSDGTNDYQPGDAYTVGSSNVTITASWQRNSLGITYNLNGATGTAPTETNKGIGDTFTLAGVVAWINRTFLGWFDGTTLFAASDTYRMSGEPVELVARWVNNIFAAAFLPGGATGSTPVDVQREFGQTFTLPSAAGLSKPGFNFAGWTDGLQTHQPGDIIAMPSQGTSFTAMWNAIPAPPSNSGDSGGGNLPGSGTTTTAPAMTKIVYGTTKSLAKSVEIIGTPIKWTSQSPTCKVSAAGVVTTVAVGECSIAAIDKSSLRIANVFKFVIEPRLKISLSKASKLQPTSARLNASVSWPGTDFKAKFCVTTSPASLECKFISTVSIENEGSNKLASKGAVSISRDIQGLKPGSTYYVHAAVIVGEKSYKTASKVVKTPKKVTVPKRPEVLTLEFPQFTTVLLPAQEQALDAAMVQWKKQGLKTVVISQQFKEDDYNYFLHDRIVKITEYVNQHSSFRVQVLVPKQGDRRIIGDLPNGQRDIFITSR